MIEIATYKHEVKKICVPFGTVINLTGNMQRALGNTDPPAEHPLAVTSKQ